jgi:hypothetical protein
MNDVKDLLGLALHDLPEPEVDPAADLVRGRRRLHHRRARVLGGVTAAVLVLAVTPVAVGGFGGSAAPPQAGPTPAATKLPAGPAAGSPGPAKARPTRPARPALESIALVSYTGKQPRGYTVEWVPKGWKVQEGSSDALVIAPKGAKADDPSQGISFVGKLVVMSQSQDVDPDTSGTPQKVAGRPGYVKVQDDVQALTYKADGAGHWVIIQAPTKLGWDGARIAKFAAGVTVLSTVTPGKG